MHDLDDIYNLYISTYCLSDERTFNLRSPHLYIFIYCYGTLIVTISLFICYYLIHPSSGPSNLHCFPKGLVTNDPIKTSDVSVNFHLFSLLFVRV